MGRRRQTEGQGHKGRREGHGVVEEVCVRPTRGQNNKSASEEGARMADSLQTYNNYGFVGGPFKEE